MLFGCGEAPGHEELDRGQPFVGRSGDWINEGLGNLRGEWRGGMRDPFRKPPECIGCPLYQKGVGFVPGAAYGDRLWISNVRRCLAENETPEEKAASTAHCVRAFLEPELAMARPRTLLLIGGDALAAVTGLTQMIEYHGSTWNRAEIDEVRRTLNVPAPALPETIHTVVASLHPSFAMHLVVPQFRPSIRLTVARARRWSERSEGPTRPWKFSLDPTPDEFAAYLDTNEAVAVDVETPHEDWKKIEIAGFSAVDGHAMVVDWKEPFVEIAREFLGRPGVWKVAHNASFDRNAFAASDVEVEPPVWNTIDVASLLNPPFKGAAKTKWLNLPASAIRLIDGLFNWKNPDRPGVRAMYRAAWPWVPEFQHPKLYNAVDVIVTRLLRRAQEEALEMEGML